MTDKGITLCNFSRGGSCRGELNNLTQFYTAMTGEKTNHYSTCTDYINYVDLELTIVRASQCDECIYYLHSDIQSSCLILNVTIDVQDMIPLCNASLLDGNKFVNLSCKWFPRAYGDRMQLLVRNQTMQSFEYEPPTIELGAMRARNATRVISATISIQDMFDNRIPDICIVSNPTMGFEDQCNFELFMSAIVREISDKRNEIIFTCCTETDEVPSFWWYIKNTELRPVNLVGQSLKLHINDSNVSSSASNELVALICGKEMGNGLVLYGIGELANNLRYNKGVTILSKIVAERAGSGVPHNKQRFLHRFNITAICYPPINNNLFRVFSDNEMWISIIVILAISLMLNIFVCLKNVITS